MTGSAGRAAFEALLEEAATAAALADGTDPEAVAALLPLLHRLSALLAGAGGPRHAQVLELTAYFEDHVASKDSDGSALINDLTGMLSRFQRDLEGGPAGAPPAAGGAPTASPPSRVQRDEATLETFAAFLEESDEGLRRADELLLGVERSGGTPDAVHELFRVFHSIKGVAGFLELPQVTAVAHRTETLLDEVRDGARTLEGDALDVTFGSTGLLQRLLGSVREALAAATAVAALPEVQPHLDRLDAVLLAQPVPPAVVADLVAAAPPAAAPPVGSSGPVAPRERVRETLKVDVERVDRVVELIGELIVAESMVVGAPELQSVASRSLRHALGQLAKISRDLQDVAMRMRMVPVRATFQKMARLVRDLGRKTGKDVVLVPVGEDTEFDRSMSERIEEPLVHMIRNAVDHGVEPPEERRAAGKPVQATVTLAAYQEGGSVVIELSDDGRGLAREPILRKARERGLVHPEAQLSDAQVHELIFAPGFSTASNVTELSGRGVGMDVVKRNVEAMRGRVQLQSVQGRGTTFRLVLPMTLAVIDGLLVSCGPERFILPALGVLETVQVSPRLLHVLGARGEYVDVRGELLPLHRLDRLFDVEGALQDPLEALILVVESAGRRITLMVDEILAQQQVVTRPLAGVGRVPHFSGAAILADGRAGLIVNLDGLTDSPRHEVLA